MFVSEGVCSATAFGFWGGECSRKPLPSKALEDNAQNSIEKERR